MQKNVGRLDRTSRIIGGTGIALLTRNPALKLLGSLLAVEGIMGYCLGYDLLQVTTRDEP